MRIGAHMSVAGGVSQAVDRARGARLRGAADLHARTRTSGAASRSTRRRSARSAAASTRPASRPVVSHASYLINLATTDSRCCASSRSPPSSTSSIAPHALGLLGVVIHPGTCTAGTEDDALRLIAERDPRRVQGAAAAQDDGAARAHRGPGADARVPLRASRGDHRAPRRLAARRRLPRHLPPRRVRLRHRRAERDTTTTFAAFERLVGLDRLQGVSRQRLEEAVRQPRRSARAHRRRLPRRARSAGCSTTPVCRPADPDRDGEVDGLGEAGIIVADPLDMKNLETLRRLRSG